MMPRLGRMLKPETKPLPGHKEPEMHLRPILLILLLIFSSAAVTACAKAPTAIVLTPPKALMLPCEKPRVPESMMHGDDIKTYAVAATRYIIDLQEALDICDAKLTGLREWSTKVGGGRHGRSSND